MGAQLRFEATRVRFDISYTDKYGRATGELLCIGPSHTAALRHLMVYLEKHPSFKLDYHKNPTKIIGLDGFFYADWGTSDIRRLITGNNSGTIIQCSTDSIEIQAPEGSGALDR